MSRRSAVLGAVAILAVLALGISNASAASLSVVAGKLGSFNVADRCVTGPLPVTVAGTPTAGSYPQVLIGAVPAACSGKAIKLTVFGTGWSVLGTSQAVATASTGSTTVTMTAAYPGASVLGAALSIGGYGVTTSWTFTPPVSYPTCQVYRLVGGVETARPGSTCTVTGLTVDSSWGTVGSRMANVSIAFSYSGATYPDYFKFTVDMTTATGLPAGWNWATSGTNGGNLVLSPSYHCSSLPILSGSSDPGWGPTNGFQFQIVEKRAGQTVTCAG